MKLINIGNRGYREYETPDRRFHAKWTDRHGTRSNYTVTDRNTGKSCRADNLDEVREAIRFPCSGQRRWTTARKEQAVSRFKVGDCVRVHVLLRSRRRGNVCEREDCEELHSMARCSRCRGPHTWPTLVDNARHAPVTD